MKRTRIINDPSDFVPILQAFGSKIHKSVFDELSADWKTEKDLERLLGVEIIESIGVLLKGGFLEYRWKLPEPGKIPEMEYHASYNKVRANFQCSLQELSDLIRITFMNDAEIREIEFKIIEQIISKNETISGICRDLGMSSMFFKGIMKKSKRLSISGQKVLVKI